MLLFDIHNGSWAIFAAAMAGIGKTFVIFAIHLAQFLGASTSTRVMIAVHYSKIVSSPFQLHPYLFTGVMQYILRPNIKIKGGIFLLGLLKWPVGAFWNDIYCGTCCRDHFG